MKVKRLFLQTILDCTILLYTFLSFCQGGNDCFDKFADFDIFRLHLLFIFSRKPKNFS